MKLTKILFAILIAALVSACAGIPQQSQQPRYGQQAGQVYNGQPTSGSNMQDAQPNMKCNFKDAEDRVIATAWTNEGDAGCAKLQAMRGTQQNPQSTERVAQAGKKPACTVNTGTEKFYFNLVDGKMIDGAQCDRYVSKLDPLPK